MTVRYITGSSIGLIVGVAAGVVIFVVIIVVVAAVVVFVVTKKPATANSELVYEAPSFVTVCSRITVFTKMLRH